MKILTKLLENKFKLRLSEIKNVTMDSRTVEKDSLFFAINSGNSYASEVLKKGGIVIADGYEGEHPRLIKVEDTIKTMQDLAREYRRALKIKVVAITGSNGKTTTKDMVHSVLSQKFKAKKTLGNYNNHIGLPYTILCLEDGDEVAVLEMGMSDLGEIDTLCKIAEPDFGIITNIGASHLEFLKSVENVFKAKTEMLKYISPENTFLFGDDKFLSKVEGRKVGYEEINDYRITDFEDSIEGASFKIGKRAYKISINGRHNAINGSFAVSIGEAFGLSYEEIQRGLNATKTSSMRFEKIKIGEDIYINDAYNASSVVAMGYSLETFGSLFEGYFKVAILGDMLEMGEREIEFHKEVIEKAVSIDCDLVFLVGKRMRVAYEILKKSEVVDISKVTVFEEKSEIISELEKIHTKKAVFIKGSRGMKMEEIIKERVK